MPFTQHVVFYAPDEQALMALVEDMVKDANTAGFTGGRLLRFRDKPGRYVIQADFDSWESAEANNERPETQAGADKLMGIVDGEIKYENLDVLSEF